MECAAGGPRNIVGPVQDLGGRIVPAVLDQKIHVLFFKMFAALQREPGLTRSVSSIAS